MMRASFMPPVSTWAWADHIAAGNGAYDGERRRVRLSTDAGYVPFWLEWESATSRWWPAHGEQPYYQGVITAGVITSETTSNGTQTLTLPTIAHPANFWGIGSGLLLDMGAETSISATGRTVTVSLPGSDVLTLPTVTQRRFGGHFGFIADTSTTAYGFTKKDVSEYDIAGSANTNLLSIAPTGGWAAALSMTGSIVFTTAAASATAALRRYRALLIRG